jgi:hypothetical protein
MAAKTSRVRNDSRKCGKASKKRPKQFDAQRRRLVTVTP